MQNTRPDKSEAIEDRNLPSSQEQLDYIMALYEEFPLVFSLNGRDEAAGEEQEQIGFLSFTDPFAQKDAALSSKDTDKVKVTLTNEDFNGVRELAKTVSPDGSQIVEYSNGLIEIRYPDGKTARFVQDENGNVKSFTDKEGRTWQKTSDNPPSFSSGSETISNVSFDKKQGTFTFKGSDSLTHTLYPSGAELTVNAQGAQVLKRADGRPETIVSAPDASGNVERMDFSYENGILKSFTRTTDDGTSETFTQVSGNKFVSDRGSAFANVNKEGDGKFSVSINDESRQELIHIAADGSQVRESTKEPVADVAPKPEKPVDSRLNAVAERIEKALAAKKPYDVFAELRNLSKSDRQQLDEIYRARNPEQKSLSEDLPGKIKDNAELKRAEFLLNRSDNEKATIGDDVLSAVKKLKESPQDESTEKYLRTVLKTLNREQMQELLSDFRNEVGKQGEKTVSSGFLIALNELKENGQISDLSYRATMTYLRGADARTAKDLADIADSATNPEIKSDSKNRLAVLQEALAGDSPEAVQARKTFVESGGLEKIDRMFSGEERLAAREYAQSGKIDLARAIRENIGALTKIGINTNADNRVYELIQREMSQEDRNNFNEGKRLSQLPDEVRFKNMTGEQRNAAEQAIAYYTKINSALVDAEDPRLRIAAEDIIANGGKTDGLAYKIATARNFDDVLAAIEGPGKESEGRLHSDPGYAALVKDAIYYRFPESERAYRQRAEARLSRIINLGSEEGSKMTFNDAVRKINELRNNPNPETIIGVLSDLDKSAQEAFRSLPRERQALKQLIDDTLPADSPGGIVARRILKRIDENAKNATTLDTIDKLYLGKVKGTDRNQVVAEFVDATRKNPKLIESLKADPSDYAAFSKALTAALGKETAERLLASGSLTRSELREMNTTTEVIPQTGDTVEVLDAGGFVRGLANLGSEERQSLLSAIDKGDKSATEGLSSDQIELVRKVLSNPGGKLTAADKVRAYVTGSGVKVEELTELVKGMNQQQKDALRGEYKRRYDGDLSADLKNKPGGLLDLIGFGDEAESRRLSRDLRFKSDNPVERYSDELKNAIESQDVSTIGSMLLKSLEGRTDIVPKEEYNKLVTAIEALNKNYRNLSKEQINDVSENLARAIRDLEDAKKSASDKATAIASATVAIVATVATAGGGVSLLPAALGSTVLDASVNAYLRSQIEGNLYSSDDLSQQIRQAAVFLPLEVGPLKEAVTAARNPAVRGIIRDLGGNAALRDVVEREVTELTESALKARLAVIPDDLLDVSAERIAKVAGVSPQEARNIIERNLQRAVSEEARKAAAVDISKLGRGSRVFADGEEAIAIRSIKDESGIEKLLVERPGHANDAGVAVLPKPGEIGTKYKPIKINEVGPDGKVRVVDGKPVQAEVYVDVETGTVYHKPLNGNLFPNGRYQLVPKERLSSKAPEAVAPSPKRVDDGVVRKREDERIARQARQEEELAARLQEPVGTQGVLPGSPVSHQGRPGTVEKYDPTSGHYIVRYDSKPGVMDAQIINTIRDSAEIRKLEKLPQLPGDANQYYRDRLGKVYTLDQFNGQTLAREVNSLRVLPRSDVSPAAGAKVFFGKDQATIRQASGADLGDQKVLLQLDSKEAKAIVPIQVKPGEIGTKYRSINVPKVNAAGQVEILGDNPVQQTYFTDGQNVFSKRTLPDGTEYLYQEHNYMLTRRDDLQSAPREATIAESRPVSAEEQELERLQVAERQKKLEQDYSDYYARRKEKLATLPVEPAVPIGSSFTHDGKNAILVEIDDSSKHYIVRYEVDLKNAFILDRAVIKAPAEIDGLIALPRIAGQPELFRNEYGDVYSITVIGNERTAVRNPRYQVVPRSDVRR